MKSALRLIVLVGLFALTLPVTDALGDDGPTVGPQGNGYAASVTDTDSHTEPGATAEIGDPIGSYHQEPACERYCHEVLTCPDGTFMTHSWLELPGGATTNHEFWCPSEGPPAVTGGIVATAFKRIPLPPSTFSIQPPGGETLVNFDTNFFTEERTLDRTVRLLGQRVDLRIWAHSYTWRFGDGQSITTRKPGAAYPRPQITHNYLEKGAYRPAMDTTWVAEYRVGGGAWQAVPGSVTIEGEPTNLRAIEARPTLVGYDG